MNKKIMTYIKRTTTDRKTGEKINSEIIGENGMMDEDEFYKPLVEVYAEDPKLKKLYTHAG